MSTEKEETKEDIKEDIKTNEELFDLSDEELKTEIRKRCFNELIDDIKENEIKNKTYKNITITKYCTSFNDKNYKVV